MIKATVTKEGMTMMASGSTKELAAETCVMIGGVWSAMKKRDKAEAEGYRRMIVAALTDESSPVWKEEEYGSGIAFVKMSEAKE